MDVGAGDMDGSVVMSTGSSCTGAGVLVCFPGYTPGSSQPPQPPVPGQLTPFENSACTRHIHDVIHICRY